MNTSTPALLRSKRVLTLVISLAALFVAGCMAAGQPLFSPVRGDYEVPVREVRPGQPPSPLPNSVYSAPLLYYRWKLVSASYRHIDVPTTGLEGAEISFEPTRIGLLGFNCASEWYGIDYYEGDRYHLSVAINAASRCRENPGQSDDIVFRLLQATDTFAVHGPALVLSGPEVILRFVANTGTFEPSGYEPSFGMEPPASIQALVDMTPLIVVATVGPVMKYWGSCGYVDGARKDCYMGPAGLPVTDFALEVEQVIRDDGRVARGEMILISEMGYVTDFLHGLTMLSGFPTSFTGDRYLYLLLPNPDNRTYGYYGPYGRLIIDSETLRLSIGLQPPLQFGDDAPVTLAKLIQVAQGNAYKPQPVIPAAGRAAQSALPVYDPLVSIDPNAPGRYPTSLQQLIDFAPLIFIGSVYKVEREFDFAGYGAGGELLAAGAPDAQAPQPTVDLWLTVEQALRDDGRIARDEPILLRKVGTNRYLFDWYTEKWQQRVGETPLRFVFLLTPNPDGETYHLAFNPWSQLIVDGDTLRLANDAQPPLQIVGAAEPTTLQQLLRAIEQK